MPDLPSFFFSHARLDRENDEGGYMKQFFEKLEEEIRTVVGLDKEKIGTIDDRLAPVDWDDKLSSGLSTSRAFVAIYTPRYFTRRNCGKELSTFLLRIPGLGVDSNGALTHVTNVLAIRWLPEETYLVNGSTSLIPPILRRIQDTPPDRAGDATRTRALKRYRDKGLRMIAGKGKQYQELLTVFALLIRDMKPLPLAKEASFATAIDAFKHDWAKHFADVEMADAIGTTAPLAPGALKSIVVFYVTALRFTPETGAFHYADQLIAEPLPGAEAPTDPRLATLLSDFRAVGVTEGMRVYHAAANPAVPVSHTEFVKRLASLSSASVSAAVVIDSAVYPGFLAQSRDAIDQIIRSPDWAGPVLLLGASEEQVQKLTTERNLPLRMFALAEAGEDRTNALRRALSDARAQAMRAGPSHLPGSEPIPILNNSMTGGKK
jgi:hypothetical protein